MRQTRHLKGLALGLVTATLLANSALAAEKTSGKDAKSKPKSITELLKDKTEYEGFLDFFQDPKTGEMMLRIDESQLNKPLLYHTVTVNGVLDAGHFKGAYRTQRLLEFRKVYDKIEIVSKTPRYIIDPASTLARAEGTNISPAVLASIAIEAEDNDSGQYLIKVDPVLLSETLEKVSPWPRPPVPGQPARPRFKVGNLSKAKTKYLEVRSYPKNSDVVVEYVFDNNAPVVRGSAAVSDPRTVTVQLQHSFIELPDNDFKPRRDDPRVGYFHQQFDELSSNSWAPYKDVINRWHLVKKDPDAAISEPVEPIVWWIENTTPLEWRPIIKEAGEAWNIAFEKAGFKNALVVKEQPDDADWDAGDIRYNVLRWTASPRPPFGGYGPSVANPLTGQIIAADIMLEYSYFRNRWLYTSLFTDGSTLEAMQPDVPVELYCSAGHQLHDAMMSGLIMADINGFDVDMKHQLIEQAMRRLILHEIGHTLGLNHNMKASQLFNASDIHDASKTQGVVTGSVMDYPAANIAPPGMTQGDYFDSRPGPYDLWAIEYGYSPALDDPDAEEARLQQLLARSTEKGLAFGNDAEDMRTPGLHIDPRVMIGDLSNEAIKYATGRFELVKQAFAQLPSRTTQEGGNYHQLMVSANYLIREWGAQAGVISRYIGGVYVDRAYVGQPGATQPYTPVDEPTQKAAMAALSQYLFAPEVMQEAQPLFAYLQPQRRGFSGFGKNEDPKLHQLVLNTQKRVLDHLLHKNVLQRLSDASLYGNQYELNEFLTDLTEAIFRKDLNTEVNTYRQNLQVEYVNRLLKISGAQSPSSYDYLSQAAATHQLKKISRMVKYNKGKGSTLVHRDYLQTKIEQALNDV